MLMRRAARRLPIALLMTALALGTALAGEDEPAPVTALSPDPRPVLIVLPPVDELMLAHHAHPLSQSKAEELALKHGLLIALPIIHQRARESLRPLPLPWRTDDPDRGFALTLSSALGHSQANWPWRALYIVKSGEDVDRLLAQLAGQDAVVALFSYELEELDDRVQLNARAEVTLVRAAGTPRESRVRTSIRHVAPSLYADPGHAKKWVTEFHTGGPLDQLVGVAALDLSRVLAVTVAHALTSAGPAGGATRHFGDLARRPKCAECQPGDPVLHEEPGRVWVAPAKAAGTILSLPVS